NGRADKGEICYVAEAPIDAGDVPDRAVIADLNGDDRQDIAISHFTSQLSIFLNAGDGQLGNPADIEVGNSLNDLAAADVDGQNGIDLVAIDGEGDNSLSSALLLLNNGDGTFAAPVSFDIGGFTPFSIAAGDLDGDSATDFVFTTHDDFEGGPA